MLSRSLFGTLAARLGSRPPNVATVAELSSLVVLEHENGKVAAPSFPVLTAAGKLGGDITALAAGKNVKSVAEEASRVKGVSKVIMADSPSLEHSLAEPMSDLIARVHERGRFTHLLAPASTFGKNVMPRLAALLGVQQVSDITEVVDADTYVRPIYAGNAMSKVQYSAPGTRVITVRPTSFPPAPTDPANQAEIEQLGGDDLAVCNGWDDKIQWLRKEGGGGERPELGSARVVVSGGRALQSSENFKMLEKLADTLGGAVGASRAAVDAGMVPNDWQVGQTGKVVAPDLYIAVGISGAIQHVAGITDSKVIVAINTDGDAPIFQVADYGLVQDLFTALPELQTALEALKKT
ncbi:hypothetical protein BSKO_04481 [Bryopsis sp. KO-2023]|nr:hypothetical protein BSKO_04481 [Bryopsis sp. KO-2023]